MHRFFAYLVAYLVFSSLCLSGAQAYTVHVRSDQNLSSAQGVDAFVKSSILIELRENGQIISSDTMAFSPLPGFEREKTTAYFSIPASELHVYLLKEGRPNEAPLVVTNIGSDTHIYVYVTKEGHLQVGKEAPHCPWGQAPQPSKKAPK